MSHYPCSLSLHHPLQYVALSGLRLSGDVLSDGKKTFVHNSSSLSLPSPHPVRSSSRITGFLVRSVSTFLCTPCSLPPFRSLFLSLCFANDNFFSPLPVSIPCSLLLVATMFSVQVGDKELQLADQALKKHDLARARKYAQHAALAFK